MSTQSSTSTPAQNLQSLVAAVGSMSPPSGSGPLELGNALFLGSGDSLAACLLAERAGHRAASAGDIAWTERLPPGVDTVVGVSQSGRTAATVRALEVARAAGLRTIAVTARADGDLADTADHVVLAPLVDVFEAVPASGYIALALGVLTLTGGPAGDAKRIAARLAAIHDSSAEAVSALPAVAPMAISVLTLPDLRSAGDFWSLKLIEATGLAVRSVPLEESGHVDYFLGPQDHLTVQLIGGLGRARHARLGRALAGNGHHVATFTWRDPAPDAAGTVAAESDSAGLDADGWQRELALAAFGAHVAETLAHRWRRPPFRGGQVPMDARHIQIPT